MSARFRVYTSFEQFEREEMRKLDSLCTTVEDMLEERFAEELGLDESMYPKKRRRRRA